jgi:protein SCO1/2
MIQLLLTVALWSAVQISDFSASARADVPAPSGAPVSVATPTPASEASSGIPPELQAAGITEKLGNRVPIQSLTFTSESGTEVPLSSYFSRGKPIVVAMVYYECPNLCNFLLNGLTDTLKKMDWVPGNQFDIVAVSINPQEGPELAAKKKAAYIASYGKPEAAKGWHLLTGKESQIKQFAFELGFGYTYDQKEKQYAHSAALFVLTPEGQLSRILYGIEFKPRDLRLALVEAADGKVGSVVDRFLLFCYRYDPSLRSYSVYLFNVMRVAGLITALTMIVTLGITWRRQLKPRS